MELSEYLSKFATITRKPNLEAMKYFMQEFKNPHKKLKIIHIAGTNGKGSVTEMINYVLVSSGYKVRKIFITTFN